MSKRACLLSAPLLVAAAAVAVDDVRRASEWSRTAAPASVTFTVTGPGKISFEGTTSDVAIEETDQHVVVVVDLRNLTTGLALRDKLMKEKHLEVDKFPEARLEVPRAELLVPDDAGNPLAAELRGTLTLHGEHKETVFRYESTCNAAGLCDVVGDAVVVMSEFAIPVPLWQGVLLSPDVAVRTAFQVQRTTRPLPPPQGKPEPPPDVPPPPSPSPK